MFDSIECLSEDGYTRHAWKKKINKDDDSIGETTSPKVAAY